MSRLPLLTLLVGLLFCASCAPSATPPLAQSRRDRDVYRISSPELDAARFPDALALVQGLRPGWLRERATSVQLGPERVQVYVDEVHFGDSETLRQIPVQQIAALEYLNGSSATQRFGMNHGAGAILVITHRR